ncbi:Nn.00g020190.m01.CDS01 [Neocucurbitaria sp. VM-36]
MATPPARKSKQPTLNNAAKKLMEQQHERSGELFISVILYKNYNRLAELRKLATDLNCTVVRTYEHVVGFCVRVPAGLRNPYEEINLDTSEVEITEAKFINSEEDDVQVHSSGS